MPIYITALELENVRCFGRKQRFTLTDNDGNPAQWNLILGDNGVGKTTLLQCLAWMRPLPDPVSENSGNAGHLDPTRIEPALDSEENSVLESLIRDENHVTVKLKAEFSVGRGLDCAESSPSSGSVTTEFSYIGQNGKITGTPDNQSHVNLNMPIPPDLPIFGYGATRSPGTLKWERFELTDPLTTLFHNDGALCDAVDILLNLDYRALKSSDRNKSNTNHKARLEKIKKIIVDVLPDIDCPDNIEILGPDTIGNQDEQSGVRFRTPYGTVPVSGLSLGYQTTLTWVLDLAIRLYERYPDHENPLAEPGVVLIDNIDHHLHPRWQRRLMADLSACFPAVQFIATAHSPLIAQADETSNLVVLRNHGGEVTIERHEGSVGSWRADQILSSDLFDVPARSTSVEGWREERNALLEKPKRNPDEEKKLVLLEQKLQDLPTAENPEDQKAMDLIRRVAEGLQTED